MVFVFVFAERGMEVEMEAGLEVEVDADGEEDIYRYRLFGLGNLGRLATSPAICPPCFLPLVITSLVGQILAKGFPL